MQMQIAHHHRPTAGGDECARTRQLCGPASDSGCDQKVSGVVQRKAPEFPLVVCHVTPDVHAEQLIARRDDRQLFDLLAAPLRGFFFGYGVNE